VRSKQIAEANSTKKKHSEPQPGDTMYRVVYDAIDKRAYFYTAVFVGRNRSWYRWKNPQTQEEWNENGRFGWEFTEEAALRYFIGLRCWGSFDADAAVDEIISACSLLTEPRRP